MVLANTTWGGVATESRVLPLVNGPIKAPLWLLQMALSIPVPFPGDRFTRSVIRHRILNGRSATVDHAAFVLAMTRSCSPSSRAKSAVALLQLAMGPAGADAITVPTTVIGGRHDLLLPHAMTQRIAHALSIRGYLDRLVVLDTGHASARRVILRRADSGDHGRTRSEPPPRSRFRGSIRPVRES